MPQSITITIQDDAKAILLLDAFCIRFSYQSDIPNPLFDDQLPIDPIENPLTIPNPETKKNFVKRLTIEWWRGEAAHGRRKEMDQSFIDEFNDQTIIIN